MVYVSIREASYAALNACTRVFRYDMAGLCVSFLRTQETTLQLICRGRVTIPRICASVEPISALSLNHSGMGVLLFYYYYLVTLISIGTREKVLSRIYAHVHVCIYVDV